MTAGEEERAGVRWKGRAEGPIIALDLVVDLWWLGSRETMQFRLTKWYFDAVSPDGRVCIAYRVRMAIGPCALHVSALLQGTDQGPLEETSALFTSGHLEETTGEIAWRCPRLEFEGRWKSPSEPAERTLIDVPQGSVLWRCIKPEAEVEVAWRGERWTGRGYAESLDMTLAPWRLPIDELLWGRFIGTKSSIVWIRWRGGHPLTLVLDGGVEARDVEIRRDGLQAPGRWELQMDSPGTLRDGAMEEVSLRPLGMAARLIPARIRRTRETKWLARATLRRAGVDEIERGWALHERVVFGGGKA